MNAQERNAFASQIPERILAAADFTPISETPPLPVGIRPAAENRGVENTSVNHTAILAEATQVWQQENKVYQ